MTPALRYGQWSADSSVLWNEEPEIPSNEDDESRPHEAFPRSAALEGTAVADAGVVVVVVLALVVRDVVDAVLHAAPSARTFVSLQLRPLPQQVVATRVGSPRACIPPRQYSRQVMDVHFVYY